MTPEQIAAGAACFTCMDDRQKMASIIYLLDQITNGGNGGSGLFVKKSGDTMTGKLVSPGINYTAQGSAPSAPASGFTEFADSTGRKSWIRASDGFVRTWDATLTADRVYTLKNASGTIPLLEVENSWSALNTFSAGVTLQNGVTAQALKVYNTISGGDAEWAIFDWTTSANVLSIGTAKSGSGATRVVDIYVGSSQSYRFGSTTFDILSPSGQLRVGNDAMLSRKAAANIQFGSFDAASPVAQTLSFQSVVAGTSNTAGANATIKASASTGNAAGGSLIFQATPAGGSGSSQNSYSTALTIAADAALTVTFGGLARFKGYTVATLPSAGTAGRRAYVTDATAPTYGAALVGGGAITVPVFDNGAAWVSA